MRTSKSKDFFSGSIVFIFLTITLSAIFFINKATSLENRLAMLGGFLGCIILAVYFIHIVKDLRRCFPFIIVSSWFVMIEPAPTDIFAVLGMLALALNKLLYKKPKISISVFDIMFLVFLGSNIHNVVNTYDVQFSYRYVSITLYLVLFYFFISNISDSYKSIEKQLNLFFIPCLITSLALIAGYFANVSGMSVGIIEAIWAEGPRGMAFFKDPNVAGPFLILPGVYAFARILNKKSKANRIFFWMFILSCFGILVTFSRAAILCMLLSTIITLVLSVDQRKVFKVLSMLFISILVIGISIVYLPKSNVFSRIGDTKFGVQSRTERIENGFAAFKKSPLIGSGLELRMGTEAPHDSYFLLLTQIGLFGFLGFWVPVLYLSWKLLAASRRKSNVENRIIFVTLGSSLVAYILFGIVIYFLHWRHFWYIAGLSAAAVRLLGGERKKIPGAAGV